MMNRLYILIVFCLILTTGLLAQEDDLRIEIDKIIRYDTEIDFKKTPGFIVSIIDNDDTYFFPFGRKNINEKNEISKDDIFEIGSVTKVFTSKLINILVKDGLIRIDDKFNRYLPEEWQNPRLENLTINDLLHHHSGLPKRPGFFGKKEKDSRSPYSNYQKYDLLRFYRDFIPDGKTFEYSHTNYALLEIITENVSGKSFQDLLDEKIFKTLSMSNTFVDFPEKKENFLTPGYDRSRKLAGPWTFSSFKGSEGVKSTSSDLTKFVRSLLTDSLFFTANPSESFNKQLSIIMGWHAIHMNDFDILTHSGKTNGHNAFIALVRETNTAVIILSNSSIGAEDLGLQVLRMINYNWKRIKV